MDLRQSRLINNPLATRPPSEQAESVGESPITERSEKPERKKKNQRKESAPYRIDTVLSNIALVKSEDISPVNLKSTRSRKEKEQNSARKNKGKHSDKKGYITKSSDESHHSSEEDDIVDDMQIKVNFQMNSQEEKNKYLESVMEESAEYNTTTV